MDDFATQNMGAETAPTAPTGGGFDETANQVGEVVSTIGSVLGGLFGGTGGRDEANQQQAGSGGAERTPRTDGDLRAAIRAGRGGAGTGAPSEIDGTILLVAGGLVFVGLVVGGGLLLVALA